MIEPGRPGVRMLQWDNAAYTQLLKAKKADTYLYTRETTQDYPNYYLADASLANGQKITDANPQQKNFLGQRRKAGGLYQHPRREIAGRPLAAG